MAAAIFKKMSQIHKNYWKMFHFCSILYNPKKNADKIHQWWQNTMVCRIHTKPRNGGLIDW